GVHAVARDEAPDPRARPAESLEHASAPAREGEHAPHHAREALPVALVAEEAAAALRGERVELRLPPVLGGAPGGGDPALLHEPHERGVDRPLVQAEEVAARLLDAAGGSVAALRPRGPEVPGGHGGPAGLD